MKRVIEICCGSYEDCLAAQRGGARRVELNSALHMGGLTPSLATLVLAKQTTSLSIVSMVRPRAAGFCYNDIEIQTMMEDARLLLEHGSDGIAFGFLDATAHIQKAATKAMVELIHSFHREAVFHRAFDCVDDPEEAIQTLIDLGVNRILTSGLKPKAMEGMALLKHLQLHYGNQIELLVGSGMNATNALEMMESTGITQVHSSCKTWATDPTTDNGIVSFAYGEGAQHHMYEVVSDQLVNELVTCIDKAG